MNRYNSIKKMKPYTLFGLLLLNLCFVSSLAAQNKIAVSQTVSAMGIITTTINGFDLRCNGSTLQTNGKLLATGVIATKEIGTYPFFLLRFLTDGRLDTSFGENGAVVIDEGWMLEGFDVFVLPNDKIVVSGHIYPDMNIMNGNADVIVLRFLPNGQLDKTFGQGGKSVISVGSCQSIVAATILQPDGQILIAGWEQSSSRRECDNHYYTGFLLRVNTEGVPDSSFGENGIVVFKPKPNSRETYQVYSLMLQVDGSIVTAVDVESKPRLMNISKDGKSVSFLDEKTWAKYYETHNSQRDSRVLLPQSDGRFLFMRDFKLDTVTRYGTSTNKWMLTRYKENGMIDSTFVQSGDLKFYGKTVDIGEFAYCLVTDKSGSIFIGGKGFIQKISPEGIIDKDFFVNSNQNARGMNDYYELNFLPDGSLLASGNSQMTLGRFQRDGFPDRNFGAAIREQILKTVVIGQPNESNQVPRPIAIPPLYVAIGQLKDSLLPVVEIREPVVAKIKQVPAINAKAQPNGIKDGAILSFSKSPLSTRVIEKRDRLNYDEFTVAGRIVMAICVDKQGVVISAKCVAKKSTITDETLIRKVTKHVRLYKFSPSDKGTTDCGEINYNFKIQ